MAINEDNTSIDEIWKLSKQQIKIRGQMIERDNETEISVKKVDSL